MCFSHSPKGIVCFENYSLAITFQRVKISMQRYSFDDILRFDDDSFVSVLIPHWFKTHAMLFLH